ncbi:hypothetical protein EQ836_24710 [Ectopseudomonas mendocina]|uniref:Restriction endonuclease n=1 Tax=Ectopseudomonas mendocina TaxID=300 RepID=A0ABD7RMU9_ECTME|nr:hypothetical protein [Pseudomonas mendocina]TRO08205.1 hypothetical protein EQ829_24700 [Pseudomonas mendocina]TRO10904.1 hypothetical protein EQ836_24710 [Pseudomonas mendocina]
MKALTLGASKEKDLMPVFRSVVNDAIGSYDDFVGVINNLVKRKITSMIRGRHKLQGLDEDQLTYKITDQFEELGFNVSHDKQVGGHVDILIEHEEYLWSGEAKKHSGYSKLEQGWFQLTTRYMTGMPNENAGSFFIYNFNQDAISVTTAWRKFLADSHPSVEQGEVEGGLHFASRTKHEGTGLPILINHYNIPLYHDPKDA